jgi:hypothetical protein
MAALALCPMFATLPSEQHTSLSLVLDTVYQTVPRTSRVRRCIALCGHPGLHRQHVRLSNTARPAEHEDRSRPVPGICSEACERRARSSHELHTPKQRGYDRLVSVAARLVPQTPVDHLSPTVPCVGRHKCITRRSHLHLSVLNSCDAWQFVSHQNLVFPYGFRNFDPCTSCSIFFLNPTLRPRQHGIRVRSHHGPDL